ncbi:MAG: M14 family zinc carboxypeptidase [Actinomycetes bacterium]
MPPARATSSSEISRAAAAPRGAAGPDWSVIGRSLRGRPILAARFGSGARHVLIVGGVHGDEAGTAVATKFAAYLARHPDAVPAGAQIDVIRCLNPDGYALHTRGNSRHVDLNRNLPTRNWRRRLKPGDPAAMLGLSGGRRPGSEPETRALLAYLERGFDAVVSLHSHAGIIDAGGPGGKALARRMSRLCGLPAGHLSYQASITGSLGGYVPAKYRIPIVTVELKGAKLSRGLRSALLVGAR